MAVPTSFIGLLLLFTHLASSLAAPGKRSTIPVTPHESYSSSIGVLGCKIDTNRVAYWPHAPDCNNICVQVTYQDRSVYLLRIDQSGGAHDISYDAWNYLYTGYSATDKPVTGGAIQMTYSDVPASKCKSLIHTKGAALPFSAANSMNFLSSCLDHHKDSYVAKNYVLYNILDPICTLGENEKCTLDWPSQNQPTCPHTLGLGVALKGMVVMNVQYGTGKEVEAGQPPQAGTTAGGSGGDSEGAPLRSLMTLAMGIMAGTILWGML